MWVWLETGNHGGGGALLIVVVAILEAIWPILGTIIQHTVSDSLFLHEVHQ